MSSLFDSGAITFIGLRAIQENTAATVPQVIGGYFGLTLILFGGGSYFWTVAKPAAEDEEDDDAEKEERIIDPQNTTERSTIVDETLTKVNDPDVVSKSHGVKESANLLKTEYSSGAVVKQEDIDPEASTPDLAIPGSDADLVNDSVGGDTKDAKPLEARTVHKLVADRTPRQQMTSYPFLLLAFFWLIHSTADQWTLTTTRDFLASLGDDDVNNRYLTIFTFMMPVSLVALPLTDTLLRRFGFSGGFSGIFLDSIAQRQSQCASAGIRYLLLLSKFVLRDLFELSPHAARTRSGWNGHGCTLLHFWNLLLSQHPTRYLCD